MLLKVVSSYELLVLSISMMGFQIFFFNSGVGGFGELYPVFVGF